MTTPKKKVKRSVTKKQMRRVRIIFWVCLLLLLIPVLIFGWILLSAALDTGSPILGDRYKDDLDPAITKAELDQIRDNVADLSGVEKSEVHMATATLRVYADISDSASIDTAKSTADRVYQTVTAVLDPSVYFTQTDSKKMYDLEVHVYNKVSEADDDSVVYVVETKTSSMEAPVSQVVSEPIDAELAQQLRDNVENRGKPTPTPDESGEMTLTGEEMETPQEEEEVTDQG
ncbi:MAG: hypothetical protein J6D29_05005 [Solobacterium sp.]|nr:hypothetical protein [Solobacterium sp.]